MKTNPPRYGEQIRRMAEDGLKKHREKGNVIDLTKPLAGQHVRDPKTGKVINRAMDRKTRQRFMRLSEVAIAALAEGRNDEWADCLEDLQRLLKAQGWNHGTFLHVCRAIEEAAIEASGNPHCGAMARTWMQKRRDILRFLPPRGRA